MVESESNDTTLMGIKSFLQLRDVENESVVILGQVKNVANVESKQINFHYLLRWCHSLYSTFDKMPFETILLKVFLFLKKNPQKILEKARP